MRSYFVFRKFTPIRVSMKKLLNNPLLHLLIGVSILLLLQFNSGLFSINNFDAENFNKLLNQKESKAVQLLNEIEGTADVKDLFVNSNKYSAIFKNEGVAFFVIQDQKQVFWTNRSINFPNSLNKFTGDGGLVALKNGYYQFIKRESGDKTYLALILIKHQFGIENEYLKNKFHPSFHLPHTVEIAFEGEQPIKTINGETLFYLKNTEGFGDTLQTNWLIVFLFLAGYLLIISFLSKQTRRIASLRIFTPFIIVIFVMISKLIIADFKFPSFLFTQELFSPTIYAHSGILPSLGDFLITAIFLSIICYYLARGFKNISKGNKYIVIGFMLLSVLSPLIIGDWLKGLINNSKINFDINYLLDLSNYSFVGIIGILLLFISVIALVKNIFNEFENHPIKQNHLQNVYWGFGLLSIIIGHFFLQIDALLTSWFLAVIIAFSLRTTPKTIFYRAVFLILIVSLTISYGFVHFGEQKENLTKEFWAKKLAKEKDPVAEYLFKDVKSKIENDTLLRVQLSDYWENGHTIDQYIIDKYFAGFWNKYNVNILVCNEQDTIHIDAEKQDVNCISFFKNKLEQESDDPFQMDKDINFLYSSDGISSYLSKMAIKDTSSNMAYMFIELFPKVFSKTEGYPKLLLNQKEISKSINLNKYSFAKYKKGKLVNSSGDFNYSIEVNDKFHFNNKGVLSTVFEDFNHLIYKSDEFTTIVLSSQKKTVFNYTTTFSYFFIITGLLILLFGLVFKIDPFKWEIAFTDFSTKIQLFIIASIFLSFILFGWGTSYYIKKQNRVQNHKNIAEKVQSVLIELEHKLGDKEKLNADLYDDMTYYLVKFSNVFYTDINLYDTKGGLLASSRPEIFETGLTSKRMNFEAYNQIHLNKKSSFIHDEKIGDLNYLSAYVPFRNDNKEILAYMNLPYFAKQNELEDELSSFFTALINIYGFLFLISTIIAVFFANYISEPVRMIKNKIGALQLGQSNDLIDWQSNDEIGGLVTEYNKKVLELESNAIRLAKSERESAWREMAKQVAHEIKNPLTPMKLSIQHLQRSAQDNPKDLNDRIDRTAKTMIEQIDTLTNIANEFSNFAKMPKANEEVIDLLPIIETTIDLYKKGDYQIIIEKNEIERINIVADKDQMSRVFNNLVKNAIQAISEDRKGEIEVSVTESDEGFLIAIKDNGIGIPDDKRDQIFVPNFTTKTTGMGLGLAMVKNIIENLDGEIWFETKPDKGTTFFVALPKA
jgi:signal transduction histidine kinase